MNASPLTSASGPLAAPDSISAATSSSRVAGLAQHLGGVLAQRRARGRWTCAGVRDILIGKPSWRTSPELGLLVGDDHLALADLVGVQHLVHVEDRLDAAVVLVVERAPLLAGALLEDLRASPWASEPGGSNWCSIRSSRSTPLHHAAQNFCSSAPQLTQPSLPRRAGNR